MVSESFFANIAEPVLGPGAKGGRALLCQEPRLGQVVVLALERLMAREVWLFGSRARGDNRPDSDWDILIVVDDHALEESLDPVRLWHLGRDTGLAADVIADRVSDLRACEDMPTTIAYDIKREGIRLA